MSKKVKEKLTEVFFISVLVISALAMATFYEKTHPKFDEEISEKEAIVVSENAIIHYDKPLGRNIDTVTKSQKVILTGKMEHYLQDDMPMMEVRLEDGTFAWICKRDIAISE